MLTSTTEEISGKEISETIGMVKGNVIRTRNVGSDIIAKIRTIVGGEVKGYTKLMSATRDEAMARMISEAEGLGADAVVSVRFTTSMIETGTAEILAYGTAVKLRSL